MTTAITLFPQQAEWNIMREQAGILLKSGFLPSSIRSPEQALAIMCKGRELGIPPMQAFSHIHVINGKPAMSSELMLALIIQKSGAQVSYTENSDSCCSLVAARPGWRPQNFMFSMKDAERAGLLKNDTWRKYPRAMLRSRCISEMARALFPDCLAGMSYTPEELGAPIVITESGEMIADAKSDAPADNDYEAAFVQEQDEAMPLVDVPAQKPEPNPNAPTHAQIKRLYAIAKGLEWTEVQLREVAQCMFNTDSWSALDRKQYEILCTYISAHKYEDFQKSGFE